MAGEERGAVIRALGKEGAKAQRQERARCTEGPGEGGEAQAGKVSRGRAAVGDRAACAACRVGEGPGVGCRVPRQESKIPPGISQGCEGRGCGSAGRNGEVTGHLPERDVSGQDRAITGQRERSHVTSVRSNSTPRRMRPGNTDSRVQVGTEEGGERGGPDPCSATQ